MHVVVCDVGLGNLRSVERALRRAADLFQLSAEVTLTRDAAVIARASKVVVPGQGGFGDCARALAQDGGALAEAIRDRVLAGVPYLGICLGLQVLFESSEEAPGCAGLGIFKGTVRRLPGGDDPLTGAPLKIPHVGWNEVRSIDPTDDPEHFYFVHSYAVAPEDRSLIAATTDYGGDFVSMIEKDNVLAVQFHPEKSQQAGLDLLGVFLRC